MSDHLKHSRRSFLGAAAASIVTAEMALMNTAKAGMMTSPGFRNAKPAMKQIKAGVLDVGYYELGPGDGAPVLLLHGFPYSIDSYGEAAPMLAERGCRVIVPYLRGHGSTHFVDAVAPRSGQQGALGSDVIAFMDALQLERAVLAGYDWGGRAACVVAALWPERCAGLVSVNGYLIQDIAKAGMPLPPRSRPASAISSTSARSAAGRV
jgi:pimeloyl-ACP methyl ester carboxylesterase